MILQESSMVRMVCDFSSKRLALLATLDEEYLGDNQIKISDPIFHHDFLTRRADLSEGSEKSVITYLVNIEAEALDHPWLSRAA